jgi:hypothetical protein
VAVASDRPIGPLPPSIYIETSRIGMLGEPDGGTLAEAQALRRELQEARAAHELAVAAEKAAADASLVESLRALDAERAAEKMAADARLVELAAEKTAVDARLVELQRALAAARAGSAALERACERAEEASLTSRNQLAECRERVSLQEARIAELLSSSSWRITAPLRAVFGPLRRR